MTFSTIVRYHRRDDGHCACVDSETGRVVMDDDKTTSEKAQAEPEPLIYPADSISPEIVSPDNTSLDLITPEPTATEQNVYEQEQHYTEQRDDLMA